MNHEKIKELKERSLALRNKVKAIVHSIDAEELAAIEEMLNHVEKRIGPIGAAVVGVIEKALPLIIHPVGGSSPLPLLAKDQEVFTPSAPSRIANGEEAGSASRVADGSVGNSAIRAADNMAPVEAHLAAPAEEAAPEQLVLLGEGEIASPTPLESLAPLEP